VEVVGHAVGSASPQSLSSPRSRWRQAVLRVARVVFGLPATRVAEAPFLTARETPGASGVDVRDGVDRHHRKKVDPFLPCVVHGIWSRCSAMKRTAIREERCAERRAVTFLSADLPYRRSDILKDHFRTRNVDRQTRMGLPSRGDFHSDRSKARLSVPPQWKRREFHTAGVPSSCCELFARGAKFLSTSR
jgi:hypothetical protein